MSELDFDFVRAWRDPAYRRSLSSEQLARMPEHPAGVVDLSDEQLASATGGKGGEVMTTAMNCTLYSFGDWKACGCGVATTALNCTNYTFQGWVSCGC